MPSLGTTLLTLVALVTSTGCYLADWNVTHIHNPRWPPHAKFHNGQTMSMGLVLGLTTLYYLYQYVSVVPSSTKARALYSVQDVRLKRSYLNTAAWVASLYWITQLSAFAYPDVLATDPEFGEGAPQVFISGTLLVMDVLGLWLEGRVLKEVKTE
ncbi:hypothetical protein N7492_000243 [Penicillium capsulatum]|uniref:Uncharacterized protein n=1 Tax=Penicillium capsulatum TaxID=69766 RepID=A0A9W9IRD9_9EURO|nr:hypothetical protein N7492_000243 [Penicillium capsulatum]KAJ6130691.1 hypothetical protein N7512_003471 [Penicillium capsulatum]